MAKGKKTGGRKPGSRNKALVERDRIAAEIAARTVADARKPGQKLGKETLRDVRDAMISMAATYQPLAPGIKEPAPGRHPPDPEMFFRCITIGLQAARWLAEFESPKFKAVFHADYQMPGAAGQPGDDAKPVAGAEIIDLKTDVRAAHHTYMRAISYGKGK